MSCTGSNDGQASIGVFLGLALVAACGRVGGRFYKFHRVPIDDVFFFLAVVTLIAGTVMTYIDIPYIYLQIDVEAGLRSPPPDLISDLIHSEKIQASASVLLVTTVFSIKFAFLFFFKALLKHQSKLMVWWWFNFILLIPIAGIVTFSNFVACDYFDGRIFVECVTPQALARPNGIFRASGILDIITDAFLISIPVLLLYPVQIAPSRKLALGAILCLSIFMILISIIRIAAGNISNGQVDAAWAIFWTHIEAAVGVIVVSVSTFRALFVARQASKYRSPGVPVSGTDNSRRRIFGKGSWGTKGSGKGGISAPPAIHTGVSTHITPTSFGGHGQSNFREEDMELPLQGTKIMVRRDIQSEKEYHHGPPRPRPSAESFV